MAKAKVKAADSESIGAVRRIVRNPLLSDVVQAEIKAFILRNGLRFGDTMPSEGTLAKQLGVSRSSVREAVKVLASFGLLETRVGSGLFVGRFTMASVLDNLTFGLSSDLDDFSEAVETRRWLELGMAEQVATSVTAPQIEEMRALLDAWRAETLVGAYPANMDRQFHRLMASGTHNKLGANLLDMLWDVRQRAREAGAIGEPRDLMENFQLHEAIFAALAARDLGQLRIAILKHYDYVRAEMAATGRRRPIQSPR